MSSRDLWLLALMIIEWTRRGFVKSYHHNKVGSQHESKLIHYLLEHKQYNPLIRPVSNLSHTIKVELGLAMIQIINVEEKSQIMKSNVWLRLKWLDYQLKWEPSDFGNVDVARIVASRVWQPDIVLFNNADGKYEVSWQPNVLVSPDGSVLWIPPAIFISSCTIHVEYFPFDRQMCEMKFGSWTFDASQLTLGYYEGQEHIDLSDYWSSGTWDLVGCPARMENITNSNEPPETQIIYTVVLRRKTLFFTINLIIPCVLISLLSLCVFYLPADAGEKMTLSISILLALVVFLLLISKILPPTSSSIPLISKFLLFTFIMNVFTITITVMIINWNFRSPSTHKMSPWVRKWFIDILPKYLMMERPINSNSSENDNHKSQDRSLKSDYVAFNKKASTYSPSFLRRSYLTLSREIIVNNVSHSPTNMSENPWNNYRNICQPSLDSESSTLSINQKEKFSFTLPPNNVNKCSINKRNRNSFQYPYSKSTSSLNSPIIINTKVNNKLKSSAKLIKVSERMRRAISAINFISEHLDKENDNKSIMRDWKYVAAVFDRIQLVIFSFVTIVGTMGILLKATFILDNINESDIIQMFSNPILKKD